MINCRLAIALSALAIFALLEYLVILWLNQGTFIFSLDDPYIHLALAENILRGHYGINLHEFSAPSSSILWPLLITPFAAISSVSLASSLLLLFNLLLAAFSLVCFDAILQSIARISKSTLSDGMRMFWLLSFIVVANLVGLAFIGMEHNLQLLLVMLVFLGLLGVIEKQAAPAWLYLAIIALPLLRYETIVVSGGALVFLLLHHKARQAVITGAILAASLLLFSVFLLSLGLGYLPDSVLAKSDVAVSGLAKLAGNFWHNITQPSPPMPKGLFILLAAIFCFWQSFRQAKSINYLLKLCALMFVGHLIGGRIGWFWRYELYIWVLAFFALLLCFYQYKQKYTRYALALFLLVSSEHFIAAALTPIAANNIYAQQYQMHRLLTEFAPQAVAVNDLGLTAFHNQNYVLDLWGLGSSQARQARRLKQDNAWMDTLVKEHDIQLVMIYQHEKWFANVPENWRKIAELDSESFRVVSLHPVSFFAVCDDCTAQLIQQLQVLQQQLPSNVFIRFLR